MILLGLMVEALSEHPELSGQGGILTVRFGGRTSAAGADKVSLKETSTRRSSVRALPGGDLMAPQLPSSGHGGAPDYARSGPTATGQRRFAGEGAPASAAATSLAAGNKVPPSRNHDRLRTPKARCYASLPLTPPQVALASDVAGRSSGPVTPVAGEPGQ